jgi:nitroreductase
MSDSNFPGTPQFELSQFEQLARKRRATRHFSPQPVERELVERLLRTAQWAPSGYNLQPTRFVVVSDPANRLRITRACMNQQAVREAPIVVVFAGDRRAADRLEETLGSDLAAGAITPDHANFLRRIVRLMFRQGPLGIGWFWKATLIPVARVFVPIPQFMAVHKRFWLAKQVMLCAMNFMLAAEAAGLGTVPMVGCVGRSTCRHHGNRFWWFPSAMRTRARQRRAGWRWGALPSGVNRNCNHPHFPPRPQNPGRFQELERTAIASHKSRWEKRATAIPERAAFDGFE